MTTNIEIMTGLSSWLDSEGLLSGYAPKYNLWSDQIEQGSGGFVLFRPAGSSGETNRLLRSPDFRIIMVCDPAEVVATQNRIDAIADYLRTADAPTDVVKYAVLGNPLGPFYLTNGRGVLELNVRAMV